MCAASLDTNSWPEKTLTSSAQSPPPVTYEDIVLTTDKANIMKELISTIDIGFPETDNELLNQDILVGFGFGRPKIVLNFQGMYFFRYSLCNRDPQ